MKTCTFSLLLVFLFAASANSQTAPLEVRQQLVRNMSQHEAPSAMRFNPDEWRLDSTHCITFTGSAWEPSTRQYYFYNAENLLVKDSSILWYTNQAVPAFIPSDQTFFTYTDDQLQESATSVTWSLETNNWGLDTFRLVNHYDNNGRLEWSSYFTYDPEFAEWSESSREILVYDFGGKLLRREAYFVFGTDLVPIGLLSYTYNDADILESDLFELTLDGGGTWMNFYRTTYVSDGEQLQERSVEYWNVEMELWELVEKEVNTYNAEGLLTHQDVYGWTGTWELYNQCDHFYSKKQSTSVGDPAQQPLAEVLMANPFQGGRVQVPALDENQQYRVTLTNMAGATVLDAVEQGNNWQLAAPQQPGVYVLTVTQNNQIKARRKVATTR